MKTYHPEPNGVEGEQSEQVSIEHQDKANNNLEIDVENICTPIDPVVEDNEAVANDNGIIPQYLTCSYGYRPLIACRTRFPKGDRCSCSDRERVQGVQD